MRKKERFVLGKRTFRSQKSKHFVLRIIGLRIYGRINRVLGMDLPVMRLYPEHSLTERETDILMKKGMYLMVIRIIQPYGVL